jgi:hypothetical protein
LLIPAFLVPVACSSEKRSAPPAATTGPATGATTTVPVTSNSLIVRGNATLDGAPFDADFVGAVVRDHGLVTPCQGALPPIARGRYEIPVLAVSEGLGCGAPGTEVVLWTFVDGKKLYSMKALPWPRTAHRADFDPSFSTKSPAGVAKAVTELSGEVFGPNRMLQGPGTKVEAFAGKVRCGIASVRTAGEDFTGYILNVVGPDSIAGCARGATLMFLVDGKRAAQTTKNTLTAPTSGSGGSFDLTLP